MTKRKMKKRYFITGSWSGDANNFEALKLKDPDAEGEGKRIWRVTRVELIIGSDADDLQKQAMIFYFQRANTGVTPGSAHYYAEGHGPDIKMLCHKTHDYAHSGAAGQVKLVMRSRLRFLVKENQALYLVRNASMGQYVGNPATCDVQYRVWYTQQV
jgi:hypothetical protein